MIPDYFVCTGTAAGMGVFERIAVYRDFWQKAIADAVNHAKLRLAIDPGRVGLLGFSLGGHLCVRQRAAAKVLIEYFAPELDGLGDGGGTTKQCQIHHGLSDNIVPSSPNANNISRLLRSEGASVEMYSYPGASHGFIGSDASNTDARANSFRRTVECFTKFL
jgi:dienelactone hydrolase